MQFGRVGEVRSAVRAAGRHRPAKLEKGHFQNAQIQTGTNRVKSNRLKRKELQTKHSNDSKLYIDD